MAKDLFSSSIPTCAYLLIVYQDETESCHGAFIRFSQRLVACKSYVIISPMICSLKSHGGLHQRPCMINTMRSPHLDGLMTAVNSSTAFDPKAIDYPIKIALSPISTACLSGTLYKEIMTQAPNSKLELTSWTTSSAEDIQKGEVLLGLRINCQPIEGNLCQANG